MMERHLTLAVSNDHTYRNTRKIEVINDFHFLPCFFSGSQSRSLANGFPCTQYSCSYTVEIVGTNNNTVNYRYYTCSVLKK